MGSSPRVGVALSSGGAAGMAHAGVLEVLSDAGIPVHCVAGTSAGAMVGAAFAAGHLAAFRDAMCALTRRRVFWLFDPIWPRSGLLEGRRPLELIRPYVGDQIESLPIGYAAIATDLGSGEEVVLRSGSVLDAIRASLAVPGILTPEHYGSRLLVDGGLVNPLPVDVALELGADVIVAVSVLSLTGDLLTSDEENGGEALAAQWLARIFARRNGDDDGPAAALAVPAGQARNGDEEMGLLDILSRATSLVQARIAAHLLRSHPPDCLISVPLPQIGLLDFHRSAEAVEAGRVAARAALPQLQRTLEASASLPERMRRWLNGHGAESETPRRATRKASLRSCMHSRGPLR